MATETETTEACAKEEKTSVGNYFISNYPPYSFWKPEFVPEALAALARPPQPDTPLGIYVHIPFCRRRCHFCYFRVYTDVNAQQVRDYADGVVAELQLYRQQAFLGQRKPTFIYFGGGTPSFLAPKQLTIITAALQAALPWDEAKEITFECEPGTLNQKKLQFYRELGVTRLSLGVENLDDHILEVNGRAHRSREILRAYDWARDVGFPQINVDLIAGMLDETEDNWQAVVAKTIAMQPDSVTIYQMEIPYNTTIYQRMKDEGQLFAPVADWRTKREWVKYAFSEFERAGYAISSAYTAVRNPAATSFVYRDELWRGADLMSLGVASFSHINGTHYQNQHNLDGYLKRVNAGELPIYRALTPTDEELLVREMILQFKLGQVDPAYFIDKFGVDIRQRFADSLQTLRDEQAIASENGTICLTRDGLLQVDRLLHAFFLSQHRDARYA